MRISVTMQNIHRCASLYKKLKVMYQINYTHARNKAKTLILNGFGGLSWGANQYYLTLFQRIGEDDLTQLVSIAFWRAKEENKCFNKVLRNEIAESGYMKLHRKENGVTCKLKEEICEVEICEDEKSNLFKQARLMYLAMGFERFYKYVKPDLTKGTCKRLCHKVFAERGQRKGGRSVSHKNIDKVMRSGGRIMLSNTTSSVYLKNNKTKIRISDHVATQGGFNYEILIPKF